MVFTSKKSAALLVLVSGASLFSADSSVSVDNASFIKKLQTQCEALNGLLGEWSIEHDKIETVEKTRKEICDGFMQIRPLNDLRDQNDAPASLLLALYHDKESILITHTLGACTHINTMFNFLSANKSCTEQYLQHVQTIKNYMVVIRLIKEQELLQMNRCKEVMIDNIVINNPIGLLTQAAKQAQSDAVKVIIYEKLMGEYEKGARISGQMFVTAGKLLQENKFKDQELQGEQANVETVQEINIKLANHNSYLKSKTLQLAQEKSEIEKECAVAVVNKEAIIDALRKKSVELESENTMLREELAHLMQPKKSSWFGGW